MSNIAKEIAQHAYKKELIPLIGENAFYYKNENVEETVLCHIQHWLEIQYKVNFNAKEKQQIKNGTFYFALTLMERKYKVKTGDKRFKIKLYKHLDEEKGNIKIKKHVFDFLKTFDFPVIITTFCFPVIESYLGHTYNSVNYNPQNHNENNKEITKEGSYIVYHIFGLAGNHSGWVWNENQMLFFMHKINSEKKNEIGLFSYMSSQPTKYLMVLNSTLPDWGIRLLMYPLQYCDEYCDEYSIRETGYWSNSHNETASFIYFLKDFGMEAFDEIDKILSDSAECYKEMLRQMEEEGSAIPKDIKVFISYASEDENIAKNIADILRQINVPAWYAPEQIRGGDKYWNVIFDSVKNTKYKVPVITENFLEKMKNDSTGLFKEIWEINDYFDKEKGIVIPIIVKGREYVHPRTKQKSIINQSLVEKLADGITAILPPQLFAGIQMLEYINGENELLKEELRKSIKL